MEEEVKFLKEHIKLMYNMINDMKYLTKDIGIVFSQGQYRLAKGTTTEYKRILLELVKIIRSI